MIESDMSYACIFRIHAADIIYIDIMTMQLIIGLMLCNMIIY